MPLLRDAGHSVTGVIRNPEHEHDIEASGGKPLLLDVETALEEDLVRARTTALPSATPSTPLRSGQGCGGRSSAFLRARLDDPRSSQPTLEKPTGTIDLAGELPAKAVHRMESRSGPSSGEHRSMFAAMSSDAVTNPSAHQARSAAHR